MDAGQMSEGEGQNHSESSRDLDTQQLMPINASTSQSEGGAQQDNVLVLRDFVTRHTFINLSVADSWRDQLLYTMPINRLGQVSPPADSD